jgi:hypothetical protein
MYSDRKISITVRLLPPSLETKNAAALAREQRHGDGRLPSLPFI